MEKGEKGKHFISATFPLFPFFPFSLFVLISHMDNETESISLFELWHLNSYKFFATDGHR